MTRESDSDSRNRTVATAAKSDWFYLTYKAWASNGGAGAPEPSWAQAFFRGARGASPSYKPWRPPFCCDGTESIAPKRPIAFAS